MLAHLVDAQPGEQRRELVAGLGRNPGDRLPRRGAPRRGEADLRAGERVEQRRLADARAADQCHDADLGRETKALGDFPARGVGLLWIEPQHPSRGDSLVEAGDAGGQARRDPARDRWNRALRPSAVLDIGVEVGARRWVRPRAGDAHHPFRPSVTAASPRRCPSRCDRRCR